MGKGTYKGKRAEVRVEAKGGQIPERWEAAENFTLELRRYLWLENICQGQFIYGS